MICKDCGFDNPKGVYRCQRCGNSLVPAIPRDSYINPYPPRKTMEPHQARKVLRIGMAAFIILIFLGLFSLVSGLFRNSSSNEEATVSLLQKILILQPIQKKFRKAILILFSSLMNIFMME